MSLATVAEMKSVLGVGSLYPDATIQEVCDAADAVLLPMLWANTNFAISHKNTGTVGTLYFTESVKEIYYVGQTVNITGAGAHFNGNKTITAVVDKSINITTNHVSDTPLHPFNPFATVKATEYQDWAEDMAIQQAALMIAVEIWQARTSTLTGSNSVDFQPSPYRMSAQLLAKVRGLIAHALDPRSMVG
jgi:hypothetical protein